MLPMASGRVYRRTKAGTAAWQRQDAGVPLEYRRLLGLIENDIHPDSLRVRFARHSPEEMIELLEELVDRGLLEAIEAKKHHDLDFTNSFSLADLRKAAAGTATESEDLDFTSSFSVADLRKAAAGS